jgi:hypothetical protein
MKTIVLLVLVAAVGCSKKPDCNSTTKGIDTTMATLQGHTTNTQMVANMVNAMTRLKTVVIKRCVDDKWSAEVVQCFADAANMGGLEDCQKKLDQGLRDKLNADIREIRNAPRAQMPDLPGHPQTLSPGSADSAAPGSAAPPPGTTDTPAPTPGSPADPAPPAPGGSGAPASADGAKASGW